MQMNEPDINIKEAAEILTNLGCKVSVAQLRDKVKNKEVAHYRENGDERFGKIMFFKKDLEAHAKKNQTWKRIPSSS